MTERAKLFLPAPVWLLLSATGCAACSPVGHAHGVYTHDTRQLVRIDYDQDGDGIIDARTYMRNGLPVRLEGDADGDGRIDRWEYYGEGGRLSRLGASTRGDGREDVWARGAGDERHIGVSTRRDNVIDRREVYRGDILLRAESDTNGDGLPDAWEEFEHGALARLLLDDDRRHGRPTRRIVYRRDGTVHVETIEDGSGDAR